MGNDLNQSLQTYPFQLLVEDSHASEIPVRPIKAAHQSNGDGVGAARKYNRKVGGCRFSCKRSGIPQRGNEHDLLVHEIASELRQATQFTVGITKFQGEVASLDVIPGREPATECLHEVSAI